MLDNDTLIAATPLLDFNAASVAISVERINVSSALLRFFAVCAWCNSKPAAGRGKGKITYRYYWHKTCCPSAACMGDFCVVVC